MSTRFMLNRQLDLMLHGHANTTSERAENTYIQSLLRCANHHVWSNSYNRTDLLFYWNIKLWILVISWFNLNDMKSFLKERVVHVCLSLITGIILTHATSLWATYFQRHSLDILVFRRPLWVVLVTCPIRFDLNGTEAFLVKLFL